MGDSSELTITLKGGECSDYIDFVIKDTSIDRWFDFNGDNFRVRLHEKAPAAPDKDAAKTIEVQVCVWVYCFWWYMRVVGMRWCCACYVALAMQRYHHCVPDLCA